MAPSTPDGGLGQISHKSLAKQLTKEDGAVVQLGGLFNIKLVDRTLLLKGQSPLVSSVFGAGTPASKRRALRRARKAALAAQLRSQIEKEAETKLEAEREALAGKERELAEEVERVAEERRKEEEEREKEKEREKEREKEEQAERDATAAAVEAAAAQDAAANANEKSSNERKIVKINSVTLSPSPENVPTEKAPEERKLNPNLVPVAHPAPYAKYAPPRRAKTLPSDATPSKQISRSTLTPLGRARTAGDERALVGTRSFERKMSSLEARFLTVRRSKSGHLIDANSDDKATAEMMRRLGFRAPAPRAGTPRRGPAEEGKGKVGVQAVVDDVAKSLGKPELKRSLSEAKRLAGAAAARENNESERKGSLSLAMSTKDLGPESDYEMIDDLLTHLAGNSEPGPEPDRGSASQARKENGVSDERKSDRGPGKFVYPSHGREIYPRAIGRRMEGGRSVSVYPSAIDLRTGRPLTATHTDTRPHPHTGSHTRTRLNSLSTRPHRRHGGTKESDAGWLLSGQREGGTSRATQQSGLSRNWCDNPITRCCLRD